MAGSSLDIYSRVFGPGDSGQMTASEPMFLNDSPEKEKLARQVMRDIEGSEGTYRSWENTAREDDRYYLGHQWDDVDRMRMEQLKRPALTFNEIKPVINSVSGLERLNRVDVRFVSRALDSPLQLDLAGDLASESLLAADDLCNASEEDSDLAKRAAITGMGWGEIKTDYNTDVNGRVVFSRLDEFEMRWDNNCKRPNLEGSKWRARKRQVSRKEFEKNWPGMLSKVDMAVPEMPYGETQKYELVTPYYSIANEQANPQVGSQTQVKKTIEVIQYQCCEMQPIYRFQDQDSGEITTLNEEKWGRLNKRMGMLGATPPPAVKQMQPVYRNVEVARGICLEDPTDLPGGFSLICMTGEWDETKKRFIGLVRDMIDPQKTKNKAISSALAFHITNSKGGVIFKTSAFADPELAKNQWSRPDAWIEANDETNIETDIVNREPAKVSPDLGMFYQEGTKAISRVSGINEEAVGLAAGQTPSQTARGRQQASLVVLGWYFDNLNRHRRERAKMMLEFIREFWTQGQLIEVGGDEMAQVVPLLKESLPLDYKMVLDDSIRHNPNLKAALWHELLETGALQWLLKSGLGRVVLQLLKFSPWPTQVVQMIQRDVAQNPPQPPGGKGQQKQGAPQKPPENPMLTQAKVRHTNAQADKAIAQARMLDQQTKTEPGIKTAEIAVQAALKAHELRIKREQHASKMQQLAQKAMFPNNMFATGSEPPGNGNG
jgi:hypothetical protein